MKKFFVYFALIIVLTFVVSCGGSDSNSSVECTTVDGNIWSSLSRNITWHDALDYCDGLNECGYSDWRLPNINELRTLIQNCPKTQTGGACAVSDPDHLALSDWSNDCDCEYKENNSGYYSKLGDGNTVWLWSSSASDNANDEAWGVDFNSAIVEFRGKIGYLDVRCVR